MVGGIPTPLKNDGLRQLGLFMTFPIWWKVIKKYSKPPTSVCWFINHYNPHYIYHKPLKNPLLGSSPADHRRKTAHLVPGSWTWSTWQLRILGGNSSQKWWKKKTNSWDFQIFSWWFIAQKWWNNLKKHGIFNGDLTIGALMVISRWFHGILDDFMILWIDEWAVTKKHVDSHGDSS